MQLFDLPRQRPFKFNYDDNAVYVKLKNDVEADNSIQTCTVFRIMFYDTHQQEWIYISSPSESANAYAGIRLIKPTHNLNAD